MVETNEALDTPGGRLPLHEYRLPRDGRAWSVLHVDAVLSREDETRALVRKTNQVPYGVSLWPAGIALAHEVAAREPQFRGRSVLELGAGVGLPGIVAASFGGRALLTDRDETALALCRRNAARNGLGSVEHRLADWTDWSVTERFDWILGADVLYGDAFHPHLRRILLENLAPGGRALIADPFRSVGHQFLEALEAESWSISFTRWEIGGEGEARPVGVFELTPPAQAEAQAGSGR